jgi:hypothetical protein
MYVQGNGSHSTGHTRNPLLPLHGPRIALGGAEADEKHDTAQAVALHLLTWRMSVVKLRKLMNN